MTSPQLVLHCPRRRRGDVSESRSSFLQSQSSQPSFPALDAYTHHNRQIILLMAGKHFAKLRSVICHMGSHKRQTIHPAWLFHHWLKERETWSFGVPTGWVWGGSQYWVWSCLKFFQLFLLRDSARNDSLSSLQAAKKWRIRESTWRAQVPPPRQSYSPGGVTIFALPAVPLCPL